MNARWVVPTSSAAAAAGSFAMAPEDSTGLFLAVALGVAAVLAILLVVEASAATFSEKHSARALKVLALLFGRDEPAADEPEEESSA
uniref:hypothetical protein n=1 Tax=Herbidospora sakaeratensis TaxID=564415 RepID=UPI000782B6BF|nr:hypothetical protein [Herbidospora sakaeratensis]